MWREEDAGEAVQVLLAELNAGVGEVDLSGGEVRGEVRWVVTSAKCREGKEV